MANKEPELIPCIRTDPHPPHDWPYDAFDHSGFVRCPGVPEPEAEQEATDG